MEQHLVAGLAVREWGDPAEPGILLWPGLGAPGAYFSVIADGLPGRAVAVDPPGVGGSAPIEPCTYEALVEMTRAVFDECRCRAVVGHSLGAYIAAGLAMQPPPTLGAAVLLDGGFMEAQEMVQLGMPVTGGQHELSSWLADNAGAFADWDSADRELATALGCEVSPALQAYLRETYAERDGQIRGRAEPGSMADLLLAVFGHYRRADAERVGVPTLLIACGHGGGNRELREPTWQALDDASSMIELHVADGWGHNPVLQCPDASASLIGNWLRPRLGSTGPPS